ncbi:MAG: hypothetical protein GY953_38385 [bacterium]|nr:hypothetical protein [bacterium]
MKKYYDNYGVASNDLDAVAKAVSSRLNVPLEEEEDADFGGRYYEFHSKEDWLVRMYLNWNPNFNRWVKSRFRDHTIILNVFEAPRNFEFEKMLQEIQEFKITLLRRSVFDTETEEFETIFSVRNSAA